MLAQGIDPELSLFPKWFVCKLAHMDTVFLLLSRSWSRTATAWPPVTVNRGLVSVCSFSLNWPFHSPALDLSALAWFPSFLREGAEATGSEEAGRGLSPTALGKHYVDLPWEPSCD